ncbi:adenylate/guanylate cyclase [Nitzschia inconspicua]|uniref:Adenylate/guanylate cyclase n=1 Tax=Nitzschia inconspicua TaxID=303405 RepID=A0A9K3M6I4_9STRA|nr:adenylate/guanylate cyclase [Nitzschia inconspicua]
MISQSSPNTSAYAAAGSLSKGKETDTSSDLLDEDASDLSNSSQNNSSSAESSSTNSPHSGSNDSSSGRRSHLNKLFFKPREDLQITGARCLFLTLLLATAIGLGVAIFYSTTAKETSNFRVNFQKAAIQAQKASNQNVLNVFESLETLSKTTTTFIMQEHKQNNGTYPLGFVTLLDTEHHMGRAREDSQAYVLTYAPIVEGKDYDLWTQYVNENMQWIDEAWKVYNDIGGVSEKEQSPTAYMVEPRIWTVTTLDEDGNEIDYESSSLCEVQTSKEIATQEVHIEKPDNGPASPIWTISPPPNPNEPNGINYNLMTSQVFKASAESVEVSRQTTLRDICTPSAFFDPSKSGNIEFIVTLPVFGSFEEDAPIVGHYFSVIPWFAFFENKLPIGTPPIDAVIQSSCGHTFTFLIDGPDAVITSKDKDVHDLSYDNLAIDEPFAAFSSDGCEYHFFVYPTSEFEDYYTSNEPMYYMLVVLAVFVATCFSFLIFDCLVTRQQKNLIVTARKQNALVSSLFPKSIQKKLMEDMEEEEKDKTKTKWNKSGTAGLRSYLNEDLLDSKSTRSDAEGPGVKPIADLFPETTIMFADIAGFTAWSSTREPSQVFTLLEGVYHDFDLIAKRRRVFKVEVVGDCYVAVAGLPDPRPDHAIVMAKFANDCLRKMHEVTKKLEVELGPDTTELGLRVGLHSGPVVAGVLRGDKSRFQLFGDTMNTTSRIESTGVANRIHISQTTANLLIAAGKEKWIIPREEKITAKGKGELTTFFLNMQDRHGDEKDNGSMSEPEKNLLAVDIVDLTAAEEKRNRTAEWTVEVMSSVLKTMAAKRRALKSKVDPVDRIALLEAESLSQNSDKKTVISEVATCIVLPAHRSEQFDGETIALNDVIMDELRNYVQTIASLYNNNPFHNFDHANHVVMSVNKLLSRIIAPDIDTDDNGKKLHDHTYGITSDPLTWFACVYSALIHDVDHPGVPNAQLVKEGAPIAALYDAKSVAEQNSFDIAWDLLMEPTYKNLRRAIYVTEGEFKRFRQLVVNGVMATDIVDKDLKNLRNSRWDAAFDEKTEENESIGSIGHTLKATIIIEHLIQASDVAHTMQHWHIYRRWNERFFMECYQAYLDGRADSNPAKTWYKGELGFFDFYIIPLAKKLKECGVFGVSSDEYLSYALQNRKEWEERGEGLVKEMARDARRKDLAAQRHALKN